MHTLSFAKYGLKILGAATLFGAVHLRDMIEVCLAERAGKVTAPVAQETIAAPQVKRTMVGRTDPEGSTPMGRGTPDRECALVVKVGRS